MNYSKQIGTAALLQILSNQTNAVRIADDQQISGQPQGMIAFNGPVMGGVYIESNGESNGTPASFNGSIMGDVNIHLENKDCEGCKAEQEGDSLLEE
jgi:nitrous oxidase accessory protein NosD